MLRVGAALIAAVLLTAQAPIRTPSQPPPNSQRTEPQTKTRQGEAAKDQRGTEQAPLIVKVVAPAHNEQEAAQEAEGRKQQAITEKNLADYTWYLVLATGALGVIALGQAGLFVWQLLYMRKGLADTAAAAKSAAEEANLSRRQYVAANRPRLRVRLLRVDQPVAGQQFVVRYEVINVGGTKATIISNEAEVQVRFVQNGVLQTAAQRRQFHFTDMLRQGEALPAEGHILVFQPDVWGFGLGPWWGGGRLRVVGIIRYMDDNGVTRRTAFFREATDDLNRFIMPLKEPMAVADHEYED